VGDEVRYFFLGKFGDKSSLRSSTIKCIEVKHCTIMEGQTVELFLMDNYLIKFPSKFQPMLDGEPQACGFISCENPRIKVVERDGVTMKAVDGPLKQLRRSIDSIRKTANSLGYADYALTNQNSESSDPSNIAEDHQLGFEINNNTLSSYLSLESEDELPGEDVVHGDVEGQNHSITVRVHDLGHAQSDVQMPLPKTPVLPILCLDSVDSTNDGNDVTSNVARRSLKSPPENYYHPTQYSLQLDMTRQFLNFDHMVEHVTIWAEKNGFKISPKKQVVQWFR
jgi:hypothetical protein